MTYAALFVTKSVSNYTHYNVWDEITYPFPEFKGWSFRIDK